MYLGRAHAGLGRVPARRRRAPRRSSESLDGERTYDYLGLPVLPAVFARSHLVLALAELGEFEEEPSGASRRPSRSRRRTRHPETLLWAYAAPVLRDLVRGHLAAAIGRTGARAAALPGGRDPGVLPAGQLAARARLCDGRARPRRACARRAGGGADGKQATGGAARLDLVAPRRGQAARGAALGERGGRASRALALFREHKEHGGEAYALRLLAAAEQDLRKTSSAQRALVTEGLALAVNLGMKPLAARCQVGLGVVEIGGTPTAGSRTCTGCPSGAHRSGDGVLGEAGSSWNVRN